MDRRRGCGVSATTSFEAAGTDFPGARYASVCDSLLDGVAPSGSSFAKLNAKAGTDDEKTAHRSLYDRVSLAPASEEDELPTDERILRFARKNRPHWLPCIITTGAICSSAVPVPAACRPTCKGFGRIPCRHLGTSDYHTNINIR